MLYDFSTKDTDKVTGHAGRAEDDTQARPVWIHRLLHELIFYVIVLALPIVDCLVFSIRGVSATEPGERSAIANSLASKSADLTNIR